MRTRLLGAAAAALMCAAAVPANAQLGLGQIVSDPGAYIRFATELEELQRHYTKLQEQLNQGKQLYDDFNKLTNVNSLGDVLNNPALRRYLPAEVQDTGRLLNGSLSDLGSIGSRASSIRDANRLFDTCAAKQGQDKTLCERAASKAAQDKAFADDAFDRARSRWDQIEGLMRQINQTHDPKGIAELQARIASETAMIQNEQVKMNLYAMAAQAEDRLIQQQQKEAADRTWNAKGTGGVTAEPLTF